MSILQVAQAESTGRLAPRWPQGGPEHTLEAGGGRLY